MDSSGRQLADAGEPRRDLSLPFNRLIHPHGSLTDYATRDRPDYGFDFGSILATLGRSTSGVKWREGETELGPEPVLINESAKRDVVARPSWLRLVVPAAPHGLTPAAGGLLVP